MEDNLDSDLRAVLVPAEAQPIPSPTRRDVTLPQLVGKVDAVTGIRRVGKSWLLGGD